MGFKEDVSRHLGRFGRKTSAMLEEARLRGRISALEGEIKNLYTTVGTAMFSMWKNQNVDTGRLAKYFEAINRKMEEIEEKKEQILQIKTESAGGTPEEAEKKPVRPLLPDYGGKPAGTAGWTDGVHSETVSAGQKTAAKAANPEAAGVETLIKTTLSETAGGEAAANATFSETAGGEAAVREADSETAGTETAVSADNVVIEEEDSGAMLPGETAVVKDVQPEPDKAEPGHIYCARCGAECPADANFCRKCGMKLG